MNSVAANVPHHAELGDFTADRRMVLLSLVGAAIGALGAAVAVGLLKLITLFTNIFFFQAFDLADRTPAQHTLGWAVMIVPVAGALIIGLMARFGSERIRGHGIPEALEAILLNGSRVEPKLAILKPLSSAISIGSGGPFGAEGPIIMTGGAFGSLTAQCLHLTSAERKTLLVAGAAAGMSATFAAPTASVLLAFELLLFEWKPRSLLPVAIASITAAVLRHYWIGPAPLFPTAAHASFVGAEGTMLCGAAGLFAGLLSMGLTWSVYFFEDAFLLLPIHWMWWPAIGGLGVGLGGVLFPEALGVGYDTIGAMLQGDVTLRLVAGVLVVKWIIWALALGSGTSGGVLAPLLMMGGALGALESAAFPDYGAGFWPLLSMAATLGGTMRSPFTATLFALELTHEFNMLFPLLVAVFASYGLTTLTMKRSILTEKVSRRGYHLSREYAVDPLEITFVRDVMRTDVVTVTPAPEDSAHPGPDHPQRLFPIVDPDGTLLGLVTAGDLPRFLAERSPSDLPAWINRRPVVARPDEALRAIVYRMAEHGVTRLPVVSDGERPQLVGLVTLRELLQARARTLAEEHRRERMLRLELPRRAVS